MSQARLASRIAADLDTLMREAHIPGVGLSVVRDGTVLLAEGYGQADPQACIPATRDTLYPLASLAKGFTATAIMQLVEREKIVLDAALPTCLGDLPHAWRAVTPRHLLTHTSGIPCYLNDMPTAPSFPDTAPEELVRVVADLPLKFRPGDQFSYCNTGYVLLGMLIRRASGKPWSEYHTEHLFRPLGMTSTRAILDLESARQANVTGYEWEDGFRRCNLYSPAWSDAAGAIYSTAADMAKWTAAFYTERLLKRSSMERIWGTTRLNSGETINVGFGWNTNEEDHGRRRHTGYGGGPGSSSHICTYVEDRTTVTVFSNIGNVAGELADLAKRVLFLHLTGA
jgi:D-alanyl-D-alanine carboxypeptidase